MRLYHPLITAACIEESAAAACRVFRTRPSPFHRPTREIQHCESILPDMTDDPHNYYVTGYQRSTVATGTRLCQIAPTPVDRQDIHLAPVATFRFMGR